jgi:EmrB/QacA subfamily drug resistance transporter
MTELVSPGGALAHGRSAAFYVLCLGQLMMLLDATIVNVALPFIRSDLGFEQDTVTWAVNAYLIGASGFLLLGGRLGDLFGKRRMFVTGLILFTLASFACAEARSQIPLVAARLVQGAGSALASSVVLALIVDLFPNVQERTRAIGVYGFIVSAGGGAGLLIGGILTAGFSWRWAFLINLPIGLAVIAMAMLCLPPGQRIAGARRSDMPSAVLLSAGLMLMVFAILEGDRWGGLSTAILAAYGISSALLVAFALRQAAIPDPLVPLRLFRSPRTGGAAAVQLLLAGGMFGFFVFTALRLEQERGYDALRLGLSFLPAAASMALTALFASRSLMLSVGLARTTMLGLALVAAALLWLSRGVQGDGHFAVDILPATFLYGIGGGLCFPALTTLALSGASPGDSGMISGLLGTAYQVGGSVVLAILGALASRRAADGLALGDTAAAAASKGYQTAFLTAAILVVAAIPLAALAARPSRTP